MWPCQGALRTASSLEDRERCRALQSDASVRVTMCIIAWLGACFCGWTVRVGGFDASTINEAGAGSRWWALGACWRLRGSGALPVSLYQMQKVDCAPVNRCAGRDDGVMEA